MICKNCGKTITNNLPEKDWVEVRLWCYCKKPEPEKEEVK